MVVRHLVVRQQPIYQRLLEATRAGLRSQLFSVLWPICLARGCPSCSSATLPS
jgi:hypothetical protein